MILPAYDVVVFVTVPLFLAGLISLLRKLYPSFQIEAELRQLRNERRLLNKSIRQ